MLRNAGLRKSVEQPVLDLNFAASQIGSNGAPDGRMNDFNRGSNAWFVDSDGLVKKSPHNLQVNSEDFSEAGWSKTNSTVEANSIAAPDGTLTADKIVGNSTNNYHNVTDTIAVTSGTQYWISIYIKVGSAGTEFAFIETLADGGLSKTVFQFETETFLVTDSSHNHVSATDVGNGWYRFVCSVTPNADRTGNVYFGISDGTDAIYDATDEFIYFWGAQISQHTTLPVGNPYIRVESNSTPVYAARLDHDPTWFMSAAQEQNLLETTDLDDNTYYGLGRSTIAEQSSVENPFGGTDGVYLHLESAVGGSSYIYAFSATNWQQYLTEGKQYTLSIYAKQFSGQKLELRSPNNDFRNARFNVDTGVIEEQDSLLDDAIIEDVGNGWFRCSITDTIATFSPTTWILAYLYNDLASPDYGLYYYGAQLEVGSTASTYHRTEGAPYYGPGATPKGLLVEEARTNLVTESEDFGTTWTTSTVTVDTDEVLAPDGATSADFLEETTATSVHEISMASLVTDATSKHVLSCFVKAQDRAIFRIAGAGYSAWATGGTWPNAFFDLSTETVTLSSGHSAAMEDYGNGWYRCHVVGTSGSSPSGAGMTINVIKTGTTTSYTGEAGKGLYVWGAQLEKGDFPTSYIQTTGNSKTRDADVATMGPTVAPDKLGTELIVDGDFSSLDNFSQAGTGNFSVSGGILEVEPTSGDFQRVYQSVPTEIGKRYRASVFARTESASDAASLWAGTAALGGDSSAYGKVSQGTSNFLEKTIDFTATTTSAFIAVGDNGTPTTTDSHFFHTLSLKEILPGTELVTNGTFDTSDISEWTASNNTTLSVSSGELSIVNTQATGTFQASYPVTGLTANRRYRVSYDRRTISGSGIRAFIQDGTLGVLIEGTYSSGDNTETLDFTAPDEGVSFTLQRNSPLSSSDEFAIDNLSVRELYPFEQYNPAEGTVVCSNNHDQDGAARVWMFNQDNSSSPRIDLSVNSSQIINPVVANSGGTAESSLNLGSYTLGSDLTTAVAFKEDNYAASDNGDAVSTDTSGAMQAVDELTFGSFRGNSSFICGHISRFSYYPRRLPDETLESLSDD